LSEERSPNADEDCNERVDAPEEGGISNDQRRLESLKLQFEWHKHFTTLISGITVLIVTLSYTVFRDAASDPAPLATTKFGTNRLLLLSFTLFFFGILWSIFSMRTVIYLISTQRMILASPFADWLSFMNWLYVGFRDIYPLATLCGGLLAFAVFAAATNS
jgi:hypothetical protein